IVALSLAANQYTPRILRNFMRDKGNQTVLGGLAGIFAYCIIVLRTIHGGERSFVPAISVMLALFLAVVAIGLFIYFIHHVATVIQVSTIISDVADETRETIMTLFPEQVEQDSRECELTPEEDALLARTKWKAIPAQRAGYLQSIDLESMMAFAHKHKVILKMECAIGDFVLESKPLIWMAPDQEPNDQVVRQLNRWASLAPYRTIDQDPAFGIRQIVDIAVKALSPGINDPTTVVTCLDYLAAILALLVVRRIPPRCRYKDGRLHLITRGPSFETLTNLAFDEIRQNSRGQPAVLLSMFHALEQVAKTRPLMAERKELLGRHAQLVLAMAEQNTAFPPDLAQVRRRANSLSALLGTSL
ncbi:MAG TPA: DUF2254 domain-containing protein, partial [Clostridia bacterium]|nr:DUF2254 domain-containing protein [Clostridia bacterium]